MKKLIILLLTFFLAATSFSQTFVPRGSSAVTNEDSRLKAKLNFYLPWARDTTLNNGLDSLGALLMVVKTGDTSLYMRIPRPGGNKWVKILKSGDATGGVTSFNTRIGAVTLQSADVVAALGYTPVNGNGTNLQYIAGDGSKITFPSIPAQFHPTVTAPLVITGVYPNLNFSCPSCGSGSGGIVTLNGLTASAQAFATGTAGTDFNINSSGVTHTFNIPTVSGVNRGLVTTALYNLWNAKQSAITLTTSGTSGVSTFVGNVLNIPNYTFSLTNVGGGYRLYSTGMTIKTLAVGWGVIIDTLSSGLVRVTFDSATVFANYDTTHPVKIKVDPTYFALLGPKHDSLTCISCSGGGGAAQSFVVFNTDSVKAHKPADGTIYYTLNYKTANDLGGIAYVYNASSTATGNDMTILTPTAGGTGRWSITNTAGGVRYKQLGIFSDSTTNQVKTNAAWTLAAGNFDLIQDANTTYYCDPTAGGLAAISNLTVRGFGETSILKSIAYNSHNHYMIQYFSNTDTLKHFNFSGIKVLGNAVFQGDSILSPVSPVKDTLSRFMSLIRTDSCSVTYCWFIGGGTLQAIYYFSSNHFTFDHNVVDHYGAGGIQSDYDPLTKNATVTNNTFTYGGERNHWETSVGKRRSGETWAQIGGANMVLAWNTATDNNNKKGFGVEGRSTGNTYIHDNVEYANGNNWGGYSVGGYLDANVQLPYLAMYNNRTDSVVYRNYARQDSMGGQLLYLFGSAYNELTSINQADIYSNIMPNTIWSVSRQCSIVRIHDQIMDCSGLSTNGGGATTFLAAGLYNNSGHDTSNVEIYNCTILLSTGGKLTTSPNGGALPVINMHNNLIAFNGDFIINESNSPSTSNYGVFKFNYNTILSGSLIATPFYTNSTGGRPAPVLDIRYNDFSAVANLDTNKAAIVTDFGTASTLKTEFSVFNHGRLSIFIDSVSISGSTLQMWRNRQIKWTVAIPGGGGSAQLIKTTYNDSVYTTGTTPVPDVNNPNNDGNQNKNNLWNIEHKVRDALTADSVFNYMVLGHSFVDDRARFEQNYKTILGSKYPFSGPGFISGDGQTAYNFFGVNDFTASLWTKTLGDGPDLWKVQSVSGSTDFDFLNQFTDGGYNLFDSLRVYYKIKTGGGTFTVVIDGVTKATINTSTGSSGFAVVAIGGLNKYNTNHVTIHQSSFGSTGCEILGYNTLQHGGGVRMHKIGHAGAVTQDYINADSTIQATELIDLHPDVVDICLSINDRRANVTLAQYHANMHRIVNRIKKALPKVNIRLIAEEDYDAGIWGASTNTAVQYANETRKVSIEDTLAFLDLNPVLGTITNMKNNGALTDGLHPTSQTFTTISNNALNIVPAISNQIAYTPWTSYLNRQTTDTSDAHLWLRRYPIDTIAYLAYNGMLVNLPTGALFKVQHKTTHHFISFAADSTLNAGVLTTDLPVFRFSAPSYFVQGLTTNANFSESQEFGPITGIYNASAGTGLRFYPNGADTYKAGTEINNGYGASGMNDGNLRGQNTAGNGAAILWDGRGITAPLRFSWDAVGGANGIAGGMGDNGKWQFGSAVQAPAVGMFLDYTDALRVPSGTTAQRPSGAAGYLRYNSDSAKLEYYNSGWVSISTGGGGGGSGTVTSVSAGTGMSFTTITASGPVNADTTILSTRLWRQKGIDSINTLLALKAPLASPTLTGTPLSPTASAGTNTTQIASTAFVTTAVANAISGVNPAVAVQAATTANVSGYTYNNGASGIGATLTQNSAAVVVIDGYTLLLNDRVLFKDQTTSANRGVYTITTLGTGIIPAVFTRSADYNQPSDINSTGAIPVVNGTVNATTSWLLTSTVNTIGTDPFTYTQFSYNPAQIALLASPAFTGTPTAPTASVGTNTTQIATTAFVNAATLKNIVSASDANTTISGANDYYISLPVVTASRTLTLPAASTNTGRVFEILDNNTGITYHWSFVTTVKDLFGNTLVSITNTSWVKIYSNGTNWVLVQNPPLLPSTVTSGSTITPDVDASNGQFNITALATNATISTPAGVTTDGVPFTIRITDNGTARTLTWGGGYRAGDIPLPTTTVISKTMYLSFIYNSTSSSYDLVGLTGNF